MNQRPTIRTDIAPAVGEQINTTREITRSAQAATAGCGDVVNNVSLTANTAKNVRSAASQSREAIEHLKNLSTEFNELVTYYKVA